MKSALCLPGVVLAAVSAVAAQELRVDEVTQPRLALSPDGGTLYFGVLGDLVAVPVTGGDAKVLTSGPAYDQAPLADPDGESLLFLSDRGDGIDRIYRLDLADGTVREDRELPARGYPRLIQQLTDGSLIGLDRRQRTQPLVNLLNGAVFRAPETGWRYEWAGLDRAGDHLVLAESGPWSGRSAAGMRLRVVAAADGSVVADLPAPIFSGEQDRESRAAVGEDFAYVPSAGQILRVDLATGDFEPLRWEARLSVDLPGATPGRGLSIESEATPRGIDRISLSPDGDRIAYAILGDLWLQPAAGEGAALRLTQTSAHEVMPQWGPDGEWLYFARDGGLWRLRPEDGVEEDLGLRVRADLIDLFELGPRGERVLHPISVGAPGVQLAELGEDPTWRRLYGGRRARGGWITYPSFGVAGEEVLITGVSAETGGEPQVLALGSSADTPRVLSDLERWPTLVRGSEDGLWLAILRDGRAWIAMREEGEVLTEQDFEPLPPVGVHWLEFSADSGMLLVAAGWQVCLFDCESRSSVREFSVRAEPPAPDAPTPLLLDHCHVVDLERGEIVRDRQLLVRDGRIATIDRAGTPAPDGVERVDCKGQFVMPGLVDMHVHHVGGDVQSLLGWGVTTVRQLGGVWPLQLAEMERMARGSLPGPRHALAGEIFEGPRPSWGNAFFIVETADEARALARRRIADGVDILKLYPTLARPLQQVVLAEARAAGVPVTVHVSDLRQAVQGIVDGASGLEHWPERLHGLHRDLVALMVASGVGFCPTLSVRGYGDFKRRIEPDHLERPRFLATGSPVRLRTWGARDRYGLLGDAALQDMVEARCRQLAQAVADGVIVLPGSDCSSGNALVGPSTYWEIQALVRGGLPAHRALFAATRTAAQFLGDIDAGRIAVGARADLLLLDANPLRRLEALEDVRTVIQKGRVTLRASELSRGH